MKLTRISMLAALLLGATITPLQAGSHLMPTLVEYQGETAAQHDGDIAVSILVTGEDPETGEPVPLEGRTVAVQLTDPEGVDPQVIDAELVTGADGVASGDVRVGFAPRGGYLLSFAALETETHQGAGGQVPIEVTTAVPLMTYTGATGGVRGLTVTLKTRLLHSGSGEPIAGEPVSFSIPALLDTTATTNSAGDASASFKLSADYGSYPLTVSWAGRDHYEAASLSRTISITWRWTFTSEQGLGTIRLNDVLGEWRVTTPGFDSGVLTGAEAENRTPNLAAASVVTGYAAGADAGFQLVGETRFGPFQAVGFVGTQPFALYRASI